MGNRREGKWVPRAEGGRSRTCYRDSEKSLAAAATWSLPAGVEGFIHFCSTGGISCTPLFKFLDLPMGIDVPWTLSKTQSIPWFCPLLKTQAILSPVTSGVSQSFECYPLSPFSTCTQHLSWFGLPGFILILGCIISTNLYNLCPAIDPRSRGLGEHAVSEDSSSN